MNPFRVDLSDTWAKIKSLRRGQTHLKWKVCGVPDVADRKNVFPMVLEDGEILVLQRTYERSTPASGRLMCPLDPTRMK